MSWGCVTDETVPGTGAEGQGQDRARTGPEGQGLDRVRRPEPEGQGQDRVRRAGPHLVHLGQHDEGLCMCSLPLNTASALLRPIQNAPDHLHTFSKLTARHLYPFTPPNDRTQGPAEFRFPCGPSGVESLTQAASCSVADPSNLPR